VHKTNKQTQQTVPQFPISPGEEEKEEKKVQSQSRTIRIVTDVAVLGGDRVSQYIAAGRANADGNGTSAEVTVEC
jgi:hypothetical protein